MHNVTDRQMHGGASNAQSPRFDKSIPLVEFQAWKFPDEESLLGTVITKGSTGMLSAQRGLGKTLLALHIGYAVAGGKPLKPWGCGCGGVVVYLDGEMHSRTLQKRLRQIGNSNTKPATRELAAKNLQIIGRDAFKHVIGFIDIENDQELIESMLPTDCCLLIIDNLSAWTSSAREDGTAFAPIKRWLAHLRTRGIAVLLIHHTGKNGNSQRGTSIHEDLLDYSILLTECKKAAKPTNGTSFLLEHTKLRELHPDLPTVCRYTFTTDQVGDVMHHHYEDVDAGTEKEENAEIIEGLKNGMHGKDIAEKLGIAPSKVSRVKTSLSHELSTEIEAAQKTKRAAKSVIGGKS